MNTYQDTHFLCDGKAAKSVEAPIQPNEVEMDPEKLKFFNFKLKVCDFAKISSSEFQNFPFDGKLSILKKYYIDMLSKYPDGKGKNIFCLFSG